METIAQRITEIYKGLPRQATDYAKEAGRRLEEMENVMHQAIRWKGWPCLSDGFLAAVVEGAKEHLQRIEPATSIIDKTDERDSHLMILMLLIASTRHDLDANLFADQVELGEEDRETFEIQWRNLGFPVEIRDKLRRVLRGS
jgi:hypothetical protein